MRRFEGGCHHTTVRADPSTVVWQVAATTQSLTGQQMERSLTTTCLFPVPRLLLRVLQRYLYDMFHCYNGIILRSDEKEENTPNEIMDYNSPFTLDEVTYNLYQVGSTGSDDVHNEMLRQLSPANNRDSDSDNDSDSDRDNDSTLPSYLMNPGACLPPFLSRGSTF
uniref:Uncharacterized protein n=1 Tax=Timema shepardi TaxID=629360 RepID=A0A7R9B4T2_TIMSH|nr:unnamed protein product [Timema shepardi]